MSDLTSLNDIGVIFNTDGISPFKSSCVTIWPVIIALFDLPPAVRMNKDNMIIVSLWVGKSKPPMGVLLEPLRSLFHKLSTIGINIRANTGSTNNKTFHPLFGIFDLVAKAPILNMMQFNGQNGCPTCLHPGVWDSSRYYLPDTTYPARTNDSVIEAANDAETNGKVMHGIKGRSVLTGIIDLVDNVPVDYMHCVLEGVVKWLMERWCGSSNHGCPYYIGRRVKEMDSCLLQQRPPHEFSCVPRSLQKRKYWKASEFRNWLLYYSAPVLASVLPALYFHHYLLLVSTMHILLQVKLNDVQILAAEEMLNIFYQLLPHLYGTKSCTLNAHSLIHLTKYVRKWGPLWTRSLFAFENMNGHITSMLHSKYRVAEQLSFSVDVCNTLGFLANMLNEFEDEKTLQFLSPMSDHVIRRKNMTPIFPKIYCIGGIQSCPLTTCEKDAFKKFCSCNTTEIPSFQKLYKNDTIYHTLKSDGTRDSSVCSYFYDEEKHYGIIQKFCFTPPTVFIKPFKITGSSILNRSGNPGRDNLKAIPEVDIVSAFVVEVSNEMMDISVVKITDLLCKCILVSCKNSSYDYVIQIPNNFEHH